MPAKYSRIYWLLIVLLAFQTGFGQTESSEMTDQNVLIQQTDWRMENLKKQARELIEAYDQQNFDDWAALTHPKIYEKDGLKSLFDEFRYFIDDRLDRYQLLPSSIEAPKELIEIDKEIFGVVSYKLNGISKTKKEKEVWIGSMVGISEDGGKSWKFAKGAAFNMAFLNIAAMISVPNPFEKKLETGIEE